MRETIGRNIENRIEIMEKKPEGVFNLSSEEFDLDLLCDEINKASIETKETPELSSKDFSSWLYAQYTGYRPDTLSRIHPEVMKRILPRYQNEFSGRLKIIRATDLEGLEAVPILEDQEFNNSEDEISSLLKSIEKEKIIPLEKEIDQALEKIKPENYYQFVQFQQKIIALKIMFDGLLMCSDRQFFDHFSNPEIGDYFFEMKSRVAELVYKTSEQRKELAREALPISECTKFVQNTNLDNKNLKDTQDKLENILSRLVCENLPENKNQQYILEQLLKDVIYSIKENKELTINDKLKALVLSLPRKFSDWYDYKTLSKRNPNYTSAGVENIALADEFIRYGGENNPLKLAETFLKNDGLSSPENNKAYEYFLQEIGAIYESRRSFEYLLAEHEKSIERLAPAEAMREVSELSNAMNSGNIENVLKIVERIEKRTIDLYHETANADAYDSILTEGRLNSAWSERRYSDTFFGGGVYFWGSQQEDWIKGGSESIHVVVPVRDLFIIRNKYNNPNQGRFVQTQRYTDFNEGVFPHSQKKYNILCMMPARSLEIKKWKESEKYPLSNEGYTAETIADVQEYNIEECNFIWRNDKHYGRYDTDYFIDEEKEKMLKEHLGNNIQIERGVCVAGFGGGEYDRLIIPRNISVLKATSVAYALRIPEVAYEDQLEGLHKEEENQQEIMLAYKEQSAESLEGRDEQVVKIIDNIVNKKELSEKERILIRYFLSQYNDEILQSLDDELNNIQEYIGQELPTREHVEYLIPKREWFNRESKIHGTSHISRVLINIELLSRLAKKELSQETNIDIKALEVAASIHDVKRSNDRALDIKHGQRAAEFLKNNTDICKDLSNKSRMLACDIMNNHCLDDCGPMTFEEKIFKDADALDRYRFSYGPDLRYMRTEASKNNTNISYMLAALSNFLISNGAKRAEGVLQTAEALGLFNQRNSQ